MNLVIYDLEIINAIARGGEKRIPGIAYCAGWNDFKNMGISCACAHVTDPEESRAGFHVFMEDNLRLFLGILADPDTIVVGFNNHKFDDQLIEVGYGVRIDRDRSIDLLSEMWTHEGLDPMAFSASHLGYGLDATAIANGIPGKNGHGGTAPVLFQQGRFGELVDYCLNDVDTTLKLFHLALRDKCVSPRTGSIWGITRHRLFPELERIFPDLLSVSGEK